MVLQECDEGYTRTSSGLYLGTCERCDCNGHASSCDLETGRCLVGLVVPPPSLCEPFMSVKTALISRGICKHFLNPSQHVKTRVLYEFVRASHLPRVPFLKECLHNTAGLRCERCQPGFYGDPVTGGTQACQACPCPGTTPDNQ